MSEVKTVRKVSVLLLAVVLAFALAGAALAANIPVTTTWPNITKPSDSQYQYTYVMTPQNSQTLTVCGADASWTPYPFTETQAGQITWSLPYGNGNGAISITSNSPSSGSIAYGDNNYVGSFANTTVSVAANAPSGVYVVQANYGATAIFDYTIAIQNTDGNQLDSVTGIDVKFVDATGTPTTIMSTTNNTVDRSSLDSSYKLFYKSQAIQNNPSAMATLDSLLEGLQIDNFIVDSVGAYVSQIDINSAQYPQTGYPTYYGWLYGVYRGGSLVGISSAVSASAFPLQSNDKVLWVYGDWSYSFPGSWS